MSRFSLITEMGFPCDLQKCEINGAVACRWQAEFRFSNLDSFGGSPEQMFVSESEMRRFFARFPQFQTVHINVFGINEITFEEEPVAHPTTPPPTINHLKLLTDMSLECDQEALLKAAFRISRPKFFTVTHEASNSNQFFNTLLDLMSQYSSGKQGSGEHGIWYDQVKNVRIVMGDVDEMEEGWEMMDISKDMAALLGTKKRVCFLLTWH